jgi:hypothetical protein
MEKTLHVAFPIAENGSIPRPFTIHTRSTCAARSEPLTRTTISRDLRLVPNTVESLPPTDGGRTYTIKG